MTTQTTAPAVLVRSIDGVGCNDARTEINYVAIVEIAGRTLTLGVTPKIVGGAIDFDWEIGNDDDRLAFQDLLLEPPRPALVAAIDAALAPAATIDAYLGGGDSLGNGDTVAAAIGSVHEYSCGDSDVGCYCSGLTFVVSLERVTA